MNKRWAPYVLFVGVFCLGTIASGQGGKSDGTGLQTSIAVDMVGDFKVGKESTASDRLIVREAEASFYAPVDHIFDGLLSLGAHPEGGETLFEVHEAVLSTTKLVPRSKVKIGQFFMGLGRLNRVHRHDWPFISAPKVHQTFFGEEGVLDSGIEYSWLLPTETYFDLTIGVTNGWVYGHAHTEGEKPRKPTHYARWATFTSLGSGDAQLAAVYLGRRAADGIETRLAGLDGVAKWKDGKVLTWLVQSEVWQRRQQPIVGDEETSLGAYVFSQYGLSEEALFGVRLDHFTVTSLKDAAGDPVANGVNAFVPTLTYRPSEFSSLRLAYNHEVSKQANTDDRTNRFLEAQAVYILGAHPAHDF